MGLFCHWEGLQWERINAINVWLSFSLPFLSLHCLVFCFLVFFHFPYLILIITQQYTVRKGFLAKRQKYLLKIWLLNQKCRVSEMGIWINEKTNEQTAVFSFYYSLIHMLFTECLCPPKITW